MLKNLKSIMLLALFGLATCLKAQTVLPSSGTWEQTTVAADQSQTIVLTGDVTLTGTITVEGTLRIESDGAARSITNIKANLAGMFVLADNGRLEIVGTESAPITIDGGANFTSNYSTAQGIEYLYSFTEPSSGSLNLYAAAISLNGANSALDMQYVTIRNVDETKSIGGAIYVNAKATVTANHCTIDKCRANQGAAVFATVDADGSITLTDTEISNCYNNQSSTDDTYGGAIRGDVLGKAHVTLINVHAHFCRTASAGGAAISWASNGVNSADSQYATLTMNGCNIHNNRSGSNGGAIDALGNFKPVGATSDVHHNYSGGNGGGIAFRLYNSTAITGTPVTEVSFQANEKLKVHDNYAAQHGGGMYFYAGSSNRFGNGSSFTYLLDGAEVYNNKNAGGDYYGGGIYLDNANTNASYTFAFNLLSGNIHGNQSQNGGGVYIKRGLITLSDNADKKLLVNDNVANQMGGGIYINGGTFTIGKGISVCRNKANGSHGGGIYANAPLTLEGVEVVENTTASHGGGIYAAKALNLTNVEVKNNNATANATTNYGGGIYINTSESSQWSGTTIENNSAQTSGGGVFINSTGMVTISGNSSISGNTATSSHGGGIYANAPLTLNEVEVNGNTAKSNGGGIYATKALTLYAVKVEDNTTDNNGGGIYINTTETSAWNNINIDGNTAKLGGGVYINNSGFLTISGGSSTIDSNHATSNGGGIYQQGGQKNSLSFADNVSISFNTATGNGGGIFKQAAYNQEWGNVNIIGNTAKLGGGIYFNADATVNLQEGAVLSRNIASADGGGFYQKNGTLNLNGGTIGGESPDDANQAVNGGGGYVCQARTFNLNSGSVAYNKAQKGGGIYANGGVFKLNDGRLNYNEAQNDGGGAYMYGTSYSSQGTTYNYGNFTMNGGEVCHNCATQGGGVFIDSRFSPTISAGTVSDNVAQTNGGGIYFTTRMGNANFNVYGGTFSNNQAENGGGFYVYHKGSGLYLTFTNNANSTDVAITGNSATRNGGGIAAVGSSGKLPIVRFFGLNDAIVTLQKNTAGQNGGGIYADYATVTINKGAVIGDTYSAESVVNYENANKANGGNGGGIFVKDGGTFTFYCGTIIGNEANRNGGGIYLTNTAANIKYSSSYAGDKRISRNRAGGNGGGIYFNSPNKNMDLGSDVKKDVFVDNNEAVGNGGGICMENGTVKFYTGEINANSAGNYGGGLYVADPATLFASYELQVNDNHVPAEGLGGGIYLEGVFKVNNANQKTKIDISTNYAGNSFSDDTRNNVYLYLPCENTPNKSVIVAMYEDNLLNNTAHTIDSHIGISEPYINAPVIFSNGNNPNFKNSFVDATDKCPFFVDKGSYTRSMDGKYLYLTKEGAKNWTEVVTLAPEGFDPQDIDSPQDLAWFISYVNGLNGSDTHYNANAKLGADLAMNENFWVPIGSTAEHPYTGTFDGNGHTLSGLEITKDATDDAEYGMFGHLNGTVMNLTVNQSYFSSKTNTTNIYKIGTIAAVMEGGTISNCEVMSFLNTKSKKDGIALGGFVGQVTGASTIENSTSSARLQTYLGGGFVGKASANLVVDNVISKAEINTYTNSKADVIVDLGGIVGFTESTSDVTISNSASYAEITNAYRAGGFVGDASGKVDIFNGIAMPVLDRGSINNNYYGGFVGYMNNTGSTVKNSVAIPCFTINTNYGGGIVGYNKGTVENCYMKLATGSGTSNLGYIVGNNVGTVNHCYAENTKYKATGTDVTNCGLYTATQGTPYLYKQKDNLVGERPMADLLNEWVEGQRGDYAKWARPTTDYINADYPVLLRTDNGYNAVASDSTYLVYGDIDGLLDEFGEESTYRIFLYESADKMEKGTTEGGAELYIGENVGLTQRSPYDLKAHVGITLDNSAGPNGANPTEGDPDAIDWHFFSTSLKDAPLGIDYNGDDSTYMHDEPNLPKYRFTADGYFPTHIYGTVYENNNSNYYHDWDFYTYFEPAFHWINFKRNSNSHYFQNSHDTLKYENETKLVPGKGYMIALKEQAYLQCEGTLNNGDVTIPLTCVGDFATGYNFLGNPYQSYLDFNKFAKENAWVWGGDYNNASYIIMDEDQKGYIMYGYGASQNDYTAPQYLHPHQGFMVITKAAGNATFTNNMREANSNGSTFRDSERPAYPLVNLLTFDEKGNRDLTTVELGRSDKGGAPKFSEMNTSTGLIYTHYENENYGIAFVEPGVSSVPVRFETTEDASYTMKWDTENGTFSYLHLIDNLTGVDVDCLKSEEYHFTSKTSDYSSRFKLVFEYTGIDENGSDAEMEETFAFFMDGNLVVNGEGNLEVIDINGRVLSTTSVNGSQNVITMPNVATGLYMLRLSSDNGVKVQKILVK